MHFPLQPCIRLRQHKVKVCKGWAEEPGSGQAGLLSTAGHLDAFADRQLTFLSAAVMVYAGLNDM